MVNLYITIGLPASGKSTWAKEFAEKNNLVIYSSDEIREELFNNRQDTEHHAEVFCEMRRRTIESLEKGQGVIYDATNLRRKKRKAFINEIKNNKKLKNEIVINYVVFICKYEDLIKRDKNREHSVGENVILRMLKNFQIPLLSEGADYGYFINQNEKEIANRGIEMANIYRMLFDYEGYDQKTKHHSHTLLGHLKACLDYLYSEEFDEKYKNDNSFLKLKRELTYLIILHDLGKKFCATPLNIKGEEDRDMHYYNHGNVSSYLYLTFDENRDISNFKEEMNSNNDRYNNETLLAIFLEFHDLTTTKESFEKLFIEDERGEFSDFCYNILEVFRDIDLKGH